MHHPHHSHVLQLDIQGTPQAWISLEHAALHVATGSVAWVDGDGPLATLRGGYNVNLFDVVPAFTKVKLFRRDRMTCAYCGQRFAERDLSCEHIVPQARGGRWTWMNLVTACGPCNGRKADRTPEEASMPLLYLPYVPSLFENFLLEGRHIRADVHEWLASRLPKSSRIGSRLS
jgi:hypothetical protein